MPFSILLKMIFFSIQGLKFFNIGSSGSLPCLNHLHRLPHLLGMEFQQFFGRRFGGLLKKKNDALFLFQLHRSGFDLPFACYFCDCAFYVWTASRRPARRVWHVEAMK